MQTEVRLDLHGFHYGHRGNTRRSGFERITMSTFTASDFTGWQTGQLCPGTIGIAVFFSKLGSNNETSQKVGLRHSSADGIVGRGKSGGQRDVGA
jgi:hypothetical protein